MKLTSGIMDPFYAFEGKRSKMSHIEEPWSMHVARKEVIRETR
jgi:hypothetical protein